MTTSGRHAEPAAVILDAASMAGTFAACVGLTILAQRTAPFGSWQADMLDDALIRCFGAAASVAIPLTLARLTWIERAWFLLAGVWMMIAWQAGQWVRGFRGGLGNFPLLIAAGYVGWATPLGLLLGRLTGLSLKRGADGAQDRPTHRFNLRELLLWISALAVTLAAIGWVCRPWSAEDTRLFRVSFLRLDTQIQVATTGVASFMLVTSLVFRWRLVPAALVLALAGSALSTCVIFWPGPSLDVLIKYAWQTVRVDLQALAFAIPPVAALYLRGYRLGAFHREGT